MNLNHFINNTNSWINDEALQSTETMSIPTMAPTTKTVFETYGASCPNSINFPLKDRINTLINKVKELEAIKEHPVRDKICALLRSALHVALMVGGIIGITVLATSPFMILGILGAAIALSTLGACNAHKADAWCGEDGEAVVIYILFGALFPLYEALGKISNKEIEIEEAKKEIETNFNKLKNFIDDNYSILKNDLEQKIPSINQSLEALNNLPVIPNEGKNQLEKMLRDHLQALSDLEQYHKFFAAQQNIMICNVAKGPLQIIELSELQPSN